MELTTERKAWIDSLSYETLLRHSRWAPIGDKWFTDETGEYWLQRMSELRTSRGYITFGFTSRGYLDIEITNGFNKASFDLPFSDAFKLYDTLEEYVKIWRVK